MIGDIVYHISDGVKAKLNLYISNIKTAIELPKEKFTFMGVCSRIINIVRKLRTEAKQEKSLICSF